MGTKEREAMSLAEVAVLVSPIAVIAGIGLAALNWILKVQMKQVIKDELRNSDSQPLPVRVEHVGDHVKRLANDFANHRHTGTGTVVAPIEGSDGD